MMSQTDTQQRSTTSQRAQAATNQGQLAIRGPRLPFDERIEERYGVDRSAWRALVEMIFPAAEDPNIIVLALSYCKQRGLDIFKRPVHIVPMYNKKLGKMVPTVWPGVSELRTTAFRTGQYAGCDAIEFGPEKTETFTGKVKNKDGWETVSKTVTYHEWARLTVYRMVGGQRCPFVGPKVYWKEDYADQSGSGVPNRMWEERSSGQHEKVAEAAALRRAFPEEIGGEYAAEEMEGRTTEAFNDFQPTVQAARNKQTVSDSRSSQRGGENTTAAKRNEAPRSAEQNEETGPRPAQDQASHDPETGEIIEGEYTETNGPGDDGDPTPEQYAESKGVATDGGPKQTNLTPEQLLIWADAQFAGVSNPDDLEPLFNDTVAPRFENPQCSADTWNALLALQRKHENRLAP